MSMDEDCLGIDLDGLAVQDDGNDWLLTDGTSRMMLFEDHEEAEQAKAIIEHYGMTRRCFVGRPDPSMEYFLVDGEAPEGSMADEDCVSFDPDALEIRPEGEQWVLADGDHWLETFPSADEAAEARQIIRRYEFDRLCFVGRPDSSMEYWRRASR